MSERNLYLISDGTGISVETLAHSITTQFENTKFKITNFRFIDSEQKALNLVSKINSLEENKISKPLIFSTIADPKINDVINSASAYVHDFLQSALKPLALELKEEPQHIIGLSHSINSKSDYADRIDAVHYSLSNDDGTPQSDYKNADIILVGVSRSGKTPTCLYLAMKFGLRAANFPITAEDFFEGTKPECFSKYKDKFFGLTIDPERLHTIRSKRRPNTKYASLKQCQLEIEQVEQFYKKDRIPYLNSTNVSVEELAARIITARNE